jgi:hypothetical protein
VLNTLLDKYADEGVQEIEDVQVLKLKPFDALGRPLEIIKTALAVKAYARPSTNWRTKSTSYRRAPPDNHKYFATGRVCGKALLFEVWNKSCRLAQLSNPLQDIMRKDAGVDGDAQRLGQLSWLLFLKIFDAQEEALELEQDNYQYPIPQRYLWRTWAANAEGITGDALLEFVNDDLFPALKNLTAPIDKNPRGFVVRQAFSDAYNYMKNGTCCVR